MFIYMYIYIYIKIKKSKTRCVRVNIKLRNTFFSVVLHNFNNVEGYVRQPKYL